MGNDSGIRLAGVGADSSALVETLRRARPAKVRAVLADGTERMVAVPSRRKRWDAVVTAVESLDWKRLELLDSAGAIIVVVAPEEEDPFRPAAGEPPDRDGRLLQLLTSAQDMALSRQERMLGKVLDGYTVMVNSMAARLAALEGSYGRALKMMERSILAGGGEDGGGSMEELGELARHVLAGGAGPLADPKLAGLLQRPRVRGRLAELLEQLDGEEVPGVPEK